MKKILLITSLFFSTIVLHAQTQYLFDGSFEITGAGDVGWKDTSDFYGKLLVNNPTEARTGNYSAWLHFPAGVSEFGELSQIFLVATEQYNCTLEFYIKCTKSSGSSLHALAVGIVGKDSIFITTGLDGDSAKIGSNYKRIRINFDTLEASYHSLQIIVNTLNPVGADTYYYLDDISLTSGFPTAINEVSKQAPSIYPTIAYNELNIKNPSGNKLKMEIISTTGQMINTYTISNTEQSIDVSKLTAGNYNCQFINAEGTYIKNLRFTKQ
jgi:hypothetical protein